MPRTRRIEIIVAERNTVLLALRTAISLASITCGDHHFVDKLALNTVHPKAMGRRETKWQVKHVHIGLVTVPHSSSFGDSAIRRAGRWEYLTPRRGDGRSDLGTWCPRVVACLTPPP